MTPIKVLIVDDSVFIRKLLTEILQADPALHVVGAANDPIEAKEMMNTLNPDVLTLDVEMPHMDGVSFLEKIMRLKPMPVVMISSKTTESADVTLRSLALGAVDFITKPSNYAFKEIEEMADVIREKVKNAARANIQTQRSKPPARAVAPITIKQNMVVAIGSSTGAAPTLVPPPPPKAEVALSSGFLRGLHEVKRNKNKLRTIEVFILVLQTLNRCVNK
jgi:two-component system chemotaxis response regulator CheB